MRKYVKLNQSFLYPFDVEPEIHHDEENLEKVQSIFGEEQDLLDSLSRGNRDVKIAILDGPADFNHPAIKDASIKLLDPFSYFDSVGGRATQHGTQVVSIIFGQPGTCLEGLAPNCEGISIPIYKDAEGGNVEGASQMLLASAIDYALDANATIINISGGQKSPTSFADDILRKKIKRCIDAGVLLVAAAGNESCACLRLPAAIDGVLAVGAHDKSGIPLESCNFGSEYANYGILAPGSSIFVAGNDGTVKTEEGSSFATAIISGLVARICCTLAAQGTPVPAIEVGKILFNTSDSCSTHVGASTCLPWPGRRLNLRRALSFLKLISYQRVTPVKSKNEEKVMSELLGSKISLQEETPVSVTDMFKEAMDNKIADEQLKSGVVPACGCGGGVNNLSTGGNHINGVQLIYALGQLDIDFGTEARRDAFLQHMNAWRNGSKKEITDLPNDREILKQFLDERPEFDSGLTWVLKLDTTVIYALRPSGAYAQEISRRLREAFVSFAYDDETRVDLTSIPGIAKGSARLLNGQLVPVLYPDLRGMYDWSVEHLVTTCTAKDGEGKEASSARESLADFLNRVYFELRNLGQTGIDRALNFSATQAWQVAQVFQRAVKENLVLRDAPAVVKSPVCRPESECYDVVLTFFDPNNRLTKASRAFRFTVDVSDVLPVMVGQVRTWHVASSGIA
jgi:cyanobactin maturation PatA/PatG family protease